MSAKRRSSSDNSLQFPRIQGGDTVGNIVDTGPNVDSARIGERVMVDFSIYNGDGISFSDIDYFGHGRDSGYAEYMVTPQTRRTSAPPP